MTLFWIIAAAMTAAAVLLLLWPLARTPSSAPLPARTSFDLAVYRDQLAEIDRDLARGVIEASQAEAARTEIGRRMLTTAQTKTDSPDRARPSGSRWLAVALAVLIPLGVLTIYLPLGRPDLPGQPFASRTPHRDGAPGEIQVAVERLAKRLEREPGDLEGWLLLGQTYQRLGRARDAADALGRAVTLSKGAPEISSAYGEALAVANDGLVPEAARQAFESVLKKKPDDPRSHYYLALARAQAGDLKGALERWSALVADSPADAPWLPTVRQQIEEAAQKLGLEVAKVMPQPRPATQNAPDRGADQPNAGPLANETAAAAGTMKPDERARMIRGMVDALAARLEAEPGDVDGWLRLARSYQVLEEWDKRLKALERAATAGPQRVDAQLAYADALLGQSAGSGPEPRISAKVLAILRSVLAQEPDNEEALWYLGLDAAGGGRTEEAATLWTRLAGRLTPGSPERAEVDARLAKLKSGG